LAFLEQQSAGADQTLRSYPGTDTLPPTPLTNAHCKDVGIVPAALNSKVGHIQAVERLGFKMSVVAGTGTPIPDGVLDVTEAIPNSAPPVQPSAT
jgi:hypothetical protein